MTQFLLILSFNLRKKSGYISVGGQVYIGIILPNIEDLIDDGEWTETNILNSFCETLKMRWKINKGGRRERLPKLSEGKRLYVNNYRLCIKPHPKKKNRYKGSLARNRSKRITHVNLTWFPWPNNFASLIGWMGEHINIHYTLNSANNLTKYIK